MIKDRYDVVVIGAGPAGSVAARFAAENGASVLILERDREPGVPVRCGEGVSHEGIKPFIEIDERWIATKIKTAGLHAPNGQNAVMYNNGDGYILERRIFDTELCNIACRKGANLLTKADAIGLVWENEKIVGVEYNHLNQKKIVKCDIVIGADGVESQVGNWAGIDTSVKLADIDTCVQYTLTDIEIEDKERCEFYFGTKVSPGGYIWIFPKGNNTANVGVGIAGSLAKDKGPKEYLDEFVAKHFPQASVNCIIYGGVPTSATLHEIVKDNLLLVGDAARQVNPLTGGGIVQGMIAASIAGKVAAEAVQKADFSKKFLKKYREQWDKRLGNKQKTMYKMKDKFMAMDDDRFNNLVGICQKIPKDKFSLKVLLREVVKGDPKMMMELAKAFVISKVKM
ncbi:MAG: digeranylgeranylglycerophospholipid reductase [Candidatus Cloacimonadota bacterium]|jgi:digeranylgeranylglycerophospholipid reductase|nr:digeranylgeranylglycerophospholipid reductase [Candidatus Cloacimonadota bacterium]